MSHPKLTAIAFAAMTLAAAVAPAIAQDTALEPQSQDGVSWVSGGLGQDELDAMRAMQGRYNLRLLFAVQSSGEYLANIPVRAVNARGSTVLDTVSRGPMLYAKLPPGTYKLTASSDGRATTRTIGVPASGAASQSFYWPAQ